MLHEFSYFAPRELPELLEFLAEHGEESEVFSGGTDLFVNIRSGLSRPRYVVDLKGIPELAELSYDASRGLSIGACVTVNRLIEDPAVREHYRILHVAGNELATYQLRNRATVVGNLVTASPCGDMTSPLLCLRARVHIQSSSNRRELPLGEFITGVKTTALEDDEIVTGLTVPTEAQDWDGNYKKLKRIKGHDLGIVSVTMVRNNGSMRISISSAAPTPIYLGELSSDMPVEEVRELAMRSISPIDDVRGSADYRSFMVGEYVKRLVTEGNT